MRRGLLLYLFDNCTRNGISPLLRDMADQADRTAYDGNTATKSHEPVTRQQ